MIALVLGIVTNQAGRPPGGNADRWSGLVISLKDGTTYAALSPDDMFAAAPLNGPQLRSAYPASATISPGAAKEATVAAFLPSEVDPTQVDHAVVVLDGKPLIVPGKFLSAEEKAANLARAHP